MKHRLLTGIFVAVIGIGYPLGGYAQSGPTACIKFDRMIFDFGTLEQDGNLYEYTFKFRNCGKVPLIIERVKSNCGCTVPSFSEKPIRPGKEGFIKVQYDPNGRPGKFTKTISVFANTNPRLHLLRISGYVKPKPKDPDQEFSHRDGLLRFRFISHYVGRLRKDQMQTSFVPVYNPSNVPVTIYALDAPQYIHARLPKTIAPGTIDSFEIVFRSALQDQYGMVTLPYTLITDDSLSPRKLLYVAAHVEPALTENPKTIYQDQPRIVLEKLSHDFGIVPKGDTVSADIKFWNEGNGVLYIRSTRSSCGCTVSHPVKSELLPGDTSRITIRFEGRGYGRQQRQVWIYTNDPLQQEIMLQIHADVRPTKDE